MILKGRREIFTDETNITKENISKVLADAFEIHLRNVAEIKYLQEYERGVQPILRRKKEVRPEINNKIVENHAAEITAFKVGYVFGSPITFVQRASVDANGNNGQNDDKKLAILNEMMFEEGKAAQDQALGKDISVCGIGYRIVLPKRVKEGVSAFSILRLNPTNAFVVKYNDIYKRNALGVSYVQLKKGSYRVGAYTDKEYFELEGDNFNCLKVVRVLPNRVGVQPIIEYKNDDERMGSATVIITTLVTGYKIIRKWDKWREDKDRHDIENYKAILRLVIMIPEMPLSERIEAGDIYVNKLNGNGAVKQKYNELLVRFQEEHKE